MAVLAGYIVFALPAAALFPLPQAGQHASQPRPFSSFDMGYGAVLAVAAGYLAALLAGRRPLAHARIVSMIIGAVALASLVIRLGHGSVWTELTAILIFAPLSLAGGWLRDQQEQARRRDT